MSSISGDVLEGGSSIQNDCCGWPLSNGLPPFDNCDCFLFHSRFGLLPFDCFLVSM